MSPSADFFFHQVDDTTGRQTESLIFMDMDDFKTVVDRLGHLNGSRALSEVAQRIQACLTEPAFGLRRRGKIG